MIRGRVSGRVWSSKRVETMPNGALLEVELADGGKMIAFDVLGCGEGEAVLITTGSVAAAYFGTSKVPIDALIVGSIDEAESDKGQRRRNAS